MTRQNKLARLLATHDVALGAYLPFPSADLVEVAGHLGFDWVFIDAEHGGVGIETAIGLVRASDAVGMASVIRVPSIEPSMVLGYLETGPDGILAPHVLSSSTSRALVDAVLYPPRGKRGAFARSRAADYGYTRSPTTYYQSVDAHAIPIAMIEDQAAIDGLDAISATPGLRVFFFGAGDLAMSMGVPGRPDHERVVRAVAEAARFLLERSKIIGMMAASPEAVEAAADLGCRLVAVDLGGLLGSAASRYLTESHRLLGR